MKSDAEKIKRLKIFQGLILVAVLFGGALWLFTECRLNPSVPFIFHDGYARWIRRPATFQIQAKAANKTPVCFRRDFLVTRSRDHAVDVPAVLYVRVSGDGEVFLNGKSLARLEPGRNWKVKSRILLEPHLREGVNRLEVCGLNPFGPVLLHAHTRGLAGDIISDESWEAVCPRAGVLKAVIADDTQPGIAADFPRKPYESMMMKSATVYGLFFGFYLFFLFALPKFPAVFPKARISGGWVLVALGGIWLWVFLSKFSRLPSDLGFDADGHWDYIRTILHRGRIPLADEGWSMFHPPLFYLLGAGIIRLLTPFAGAEGAADFVRWIPFLACFGNLWVAYGLTRTLWVKEPGRASAAAFFAAMIPMNLYMAAYVSNESLQSFLAGLALWIAVKIFLAPNLSFYRMALLGFILGMAALTKIFSAPLIALFSFFFMAKEWWIERRSAGKVFLPLAVLWGVFLGVTGWYYVRNLKPFGSLFVVNWQLSAAPWWQDPGFHTIKYCFGFGKVFEMPYYSGVYSFADAIYSTFWGDGFVGGWLNMRSLWPPWNYDFMNIVYFLAVPVTILGGIGYIRVFVLTFKAGDFRLRFSYFFLQVCVVFYAALIFYSTLRVPVFSQAKAFYGLSMIGPLTVFFTLGYWWLDGELQGRGWQMVRALLNAWLATVFCLVYLSYLP